MLKRDCVYYEPLRPEQYRAYCNRLNRVIKARDCEGCPYYHLLLNAGTRGEQGRKDLTEKLKEGFK